MVTKFLTGSPGAPCFLIIGQGKRMSVSYTIKCHRTILIGSNDIVGLSLKQILRPCWCFAVNGSGLNYVSTSNPITITKGMGSFWLTSLSDGPLVELKVKLIWPNCHVPVCGVEIGVIMGWMLESQSQCLPYTSNLIALGRTIVGFAI